MGANDGRGILRLVRAELVACSRCSKHWPVGTKRCPDDGALLDRTGQIAFTAPSTPASFGDPTPIDATVLQLGTVTPVDATFVQIGHDTPLDATAIYFVQHDLEGRDDARAERVRKPARSKKKNGSSDPPTVLLRGREDHIDLPSGSVVDDTYEIDAKLGAGAMGVVYGARHVKLGKRVAIKVIAPRLSEDEAAVARFEREARTLAQMHHPGIVDVLGFGALADGRSYFVMEHLSGETLQDRLERGRLPFEDAVDILDQLARALEAAHAHGVVHRDLKPGNTFLVRVTNEPRPIVKILDFGLAKLASLAEGNTAKTQSGIVIGTALYLSPEQARGPDVDGRSDIYALGCIAYELVLGVVPFPDARIVSALIAAHMHETPPPPRSLWPEIPLALDALMFAMLAKSPDHRPTLAQVRQAIASLRPSMLPSTPLPTSRADPRAVTAPVHESIPIRSRVPRTAIGIGATLIAGAVAAAIVGGTSSGPPPANVAPSGDRVGVDPERPGPVAPPLVEPAVVDAGELVPSADAEVGVNDEPPTATEQGRSVAPPRRSILPPAPSPEVPADEPSMAEDEPQRPHERGGADDTIDPERVAPKQPPKPPPKQPAAKQTQPAKPPSQPSQPKPPRDPRDRVVNPFTKKPVP